MTTEPAQQVKASSSLERPARLLVGAVRGLARRRILFSGVALVLTFVLGAAYLVLGALRINPADSKIEVRVHFAESGGLLPNQDVTFRGVPIGRVQSVDITDEGVVAVAAIDSRVHIPMGGEIKVSGLSPAGEQYIDFRPTTNDGPYISDGAEISADHTTTPVSLATLLGDLNGTLAQIDPAKLETIIHELGMGPGGPQKLASILDGGTFLLATLDSVLPQTVSVLRNSKVLLGTLSDVSPSLEATSQNLSEILKGVESMDGGFRTLVDRGPAAMQAHDGIVADNSPTMVQLLGNLTTVAQLSYVRVPALQAWFPTTRGSTLEAIGSTFHDGAMWGFVDIYPRYTCDYGVPRLPPSIPDFPEPYLYTYCPNQDPGVLVRGARNAPRPDGDDTAGPPANVDLFERATPTPVGQQSIPTPYGGPALPVAPPK